MKRGFTLIEVLTVILIIGILTTITTYTYNSSLTRSRDTQRLTDLKAVQNTLEQYYLDKRSYPNVHVPLDQDNPDGYPWVAKYELEQFVSGSWTCSQSTTGEKTFISPKYISSMPEDPINKLVLDGTCRMSHPDGRPRGSGQYIYAPLAENYADQANALNGGQPVAGYYLVARMERENNVSTSLLPVKRAIQPFPFTRLFLNLPGNVNSGENGSGMIGIGNLPRYYYCSRNGGNPTRPRCDFNYFLSNKDR